MSTKEQILQELEQVPESMLKEVIEFIRSLKTNEQERLEEKAWQAYLNSERERQEVYRRLANS